MHQRRPVDHLALRAKSTPNTLLMILMIGAGEVTYAGLERAVRSRVLRIVVRLLRAGGGASRWIISLALAEREELIAQVTRWCIDATTEFLRTGEPTNRRGRGIFVVRLEKLQPLNIGLGILKKLGKVQIPLEPAITMWKSLRYPPELVASSTATGTPHKVHLRRDEQPSRMS